jgi:hypothetical protein
MMRIPATLVLLGEPIEIVTDTGEVWAFKKGDFYLACNMKGSELWVIPVPRKQKKALSVPASAAAMFQKFSGWKTDWAARFEIQETRIFPFGIAESISYRSSKWSGKHIGYIHTFDHRTKIEVDNKKLPGVWRLSGSKLKVKAVGITG